jgi:Z1 domain/Type III restriction enzyme, res subunit
MFTTFSVSINPKEQMFEISKFKSTRNKNERYARMLKRMKDFGRTTQCVESAVESTVTNLKTVKSLVIYGEPQSGKTEMMIALTARLLDEGHKIIVVLLNDNVELLKQNLDRFLRSGLDPAPRNFNEILDPSIQIGANEWIIFCKKNSSDLQKLQAKLPSSKSIVIIDDEADYATPNAKINQGEVTKINKLVGQLLGQAGIYIGVTATPARLDLNNTFKNDNGHWVDFPAHPAYTGADKFFPLSPIEADRGYTLKTLPDAGDIPKHLRQALFSFLVNVAYLNLKVNAVEKNYSMLIHTSGQKADHSVDYTTIVKAFNTLKNHIGTDFEKCVKEVWEISLSRYPKDVDVITQYICNNINRNSIIVINSERDKKTVDFASATSPATLFTIAIGGNIISRGVTFDNLLSMFFTRDVKHKLQQDTYIQRARMFGTRGEYSQHFELTIPEQLYVDWHRCFIFHRLSLESVRTGSAPVWLEDKKISAVSGSSIDRTTVDMDSGQMSFLKFRLNDTNQKAIEDACRRIISIDELANLLGDEKCLPEYLRKYIQSFSPNDADSLAVHPTGDISNYKDANQELIERKKGLIGNSDLEKSKYPDAIHHLKLFKNAMGYGRFFYRYEGSIRFLRNVTH